MCVYGHGVVRGIFEATDSERLRGFEIWLPMMKGDDAGAAQRAGDSFPDERVSHLWDADRVVGELLARRLRLKSTGWDVYLLYGPGVLWEGEGLPEPALWMAQLPSGSGVEESSLLDPGRFARAVFRSMGREEGRSLLDLRLSFHARGVAEAIQKGEEFRPLMKEIESAVAEGRTEDGDAC